MTSVYLAASYSRRDELRQYRDQLRELGYHVTSSWLDKVATTSEAAAQMDLDDVYSSDMFIAFTEHKRSPHSSGGRHVELGYALAVNWYQTRLAQRPMQVMIVGPYENVFCHAPAVRRFARWSEALAWLTPATSTVPTEVQ